MLVKYDSEWLGWKQNYDFLSLPTKQEEYNLIVIEDRFVCLFVTDTIHSTVVLQIRSSERKSYIFKDPARYFSISFYW